MLRLADAVRARIVAGRVNVPRLRSEGTMALGPYPSAGGCTHHNYVELARVTRPRR